METEPEPPDGAQAPSYAVSDPDPSALLSESLDRLSMNPTTVQASSSLASAPVAPIPSSSAHTDKSLPMPPNGSSRASAPSSRRSSAAYGPQSVPSSPRLNRKSSGLSQTDARSPKPSPRRTTSQTFASRTSMSHNYVLQDETPPVTAASVASEYFKKELQKHNSREASNSDTVVIIHDSCYGHRFSRPKISKINLSFIVERPERIKAGVLGLSNAYVRLSERHASSHSPPVPNQTPSSQYPFLITKSTRSTPLNSTAVTNVHGVKWMQELNTMCNAAEAKLASGGKELNRPETPGATSTKPKFHEGDLYLCKESLAAFQGALGGVLDGVDAVFENSTSLPTASSPQKKAFVCVRPPGHHCSADMPSGFCWLNNVHVGIEHAALNHGLTHAAIIDFDLHHGDGSQQITWDRNARAIRMPKNTPLSKKTSIGYFSLHDINSYPCEDGNREKVQNASLCIENAHGQSIWNVHLQPWKTEADFWDLYRTRYLVLLDKALAFLRAQTQRIQASSSAVKPKAAIFISAGFDASEWEGEGMQRHKVNVPTEFYARFTADILKVAKEEGTSVEGRVISVLEGGYSDRALMSGILSHLTGLVGPPAPMTNGTGEIGTEENHYVNTENAFKVCKDWWSSAAFSELEALMKPEPVPEPSRKIRSSELATYASPTQSFTAKVVDPSKVYRSLSGVGPVPEIVRPPTPPIPEVDWATAVHELSKLLIPTDRRVDSCRHEELSEPRIKRERHSSIGLPSAEPPNKSAVQTRGRREKAPAMSGPVADSTMDLPARPTSQGRRRTISDLPAVPDEQAGVPLNGLGISTERPSTSDSKAHSEGSTSQYDASQSVFSNPIAPNAAEGVKLGRTRRQSGALADIRRMTEVPPPVPPMPQDTKPAPKKRASKVAARDQGPNTAAVARQTTDMDSITNGVKKITLRMPEAGQESKAAVPAAKPAAKAPRKAPVPRAPKATIVKAPASRATKTPKTASTSLPGEPQTVAQLNDESVKASEALGASSTVAAPVVVPEHPPPSPKPEFAVPAATQGPIPDHLQPQQSIVASQEPVVNDSTASSMPPLLDSITPVVHSANIGTTPPESATQVEPGNMVNPVAPSTEFVPYVPPAQADANISTGIKPDSLTWLPPNTNTPVQSPVAKRGKENLPVFTADGPIPFAFIQKKQEPDVAADVPANPGAETGANVKREGTSIWDVPETPQR